MVNNCKEHQMTRKFNVGDVVINFESLALWDNTYHFEKTLHYFKKEVVVDADDYAFTTVPGIDVTKRLSMDWQEQNKLYSQRDGRQWGDTGASTRAYVNWTTNENNIRAYLDNMFNEVFAKCDERDADEIAKLEAEIAARQRQLEVVKAGKRPISYNQKFIERDFLNERKQTLLDILNG
jgi:hypothetical protein